MSKRMLGLTLEKPNPWFGQNLPFFEIFSQTLVWRFSTSSQTFSKCFSSTEPISVFLNLRNKESL